MSEFDERDMDNLVRESIGMATHDPDDDLPGGEVYDLRDPADRPLESRLLVDGIMALPKASQRRKYDMCLGAVAGLAEDTKKGRATYEGLKDELIAFATSQHKPWKAFAEDVYDMLDIAKEAREGLTFVEDPYRKSQYGVWAEGVISALKGHFVPPPTDVSKKKRPKTARKRVGAAGGLLAVAATVVVGGIILCVPEARDDQEPGAAVPADADSDYESAKVISNTAFMNMETGQYGGCKVHLVRPDDTDYWVEFGPDDRDNACKTLKVGSLLHRRTDSRGQYDLCWDPDPRNCSR